jgi:hypothetical protein
LKDSLTDAALLELECVGPETMYSLREFHDVHKQVILGAQFQISGGLTALAAGIAFPTILPIMDPIAGTLIAEGVCNIVIEFLSKGQTDFDIASYVKGKCISFVIALATMVISALATSTKILDRAVKACKSLSALLRKCP